MMRRLMLLVAALPLVWLCSCSDVADKAEISPQAHLGVEVWKQSTFQDFVRGHFGDAGANAYVSARGRIQTMNRWDLNDDGEIDLVFANSHPQAEKLDAALYWGNGKDFSDQRVSAVPNEGAQHYEAADLDGDGKIDLVVANYANGTWAKMPSAAYYGGERDSQGPGDPWPNAPFARKISLPTEAAQAAA